MKQWFAGAVLLVVAQLSLTGCELAYKSKVRKSVEEIVKECDGKVGELALVQDAPNRFSGFAKVIVSGEDYNTSFNVKTGAAGDVVVVLEDDICGMHAIRMGIKAIGDMFQAE